MCEIVVAHRGRDDGGVEENCVEEFLAELVVYAYEAAAGGEVAGGGFGAAFEGCGGVLFEDVFVDFVAEFAGEGEEGG